MLAFFRFYATKLGLGVGYAFLLLVLLVAFVLIIPGPSKTSVIVYIPWDSNAQQIAYDLKEKQLIHHRKMFLLFLRLFDRDKRLLAGDFLLPPKINLLNLIFYITNHDNQYLHKITIIEGSTVDQALAYIRDSSVLSGDITITPKEGELMPDTYLVPRGYLRDQLILLMQNQLYNYLDELWEDRDPSLPYKNKLESLIMASLIEREAPKIEERPTISGVFINRLNKRMRLQTDPSVAYGFGILDATKLTKKHLETFNPYNTYRINRFPPTPIALPSRTSLQATFYPQKHNYLYFVANGNGGHYFSETLVEHNRNVRKWVLTRRQQK